MVDNHSLFASGFHVVVSSVPVVVGGNLIAGISKPQTFVLHPTSQPRRPDMLPAIIATLNQHRLVSPKVMFYTDGSIADLLYNFDFLQKSDMYLQYTDILTNIATHPIHGNPRQGILFMKKFLSAVSQIALDAVVATKDEKNAHINFTSLSGFDLYWENYLHKSFLENIDEEKIYSQHTKLSQDISAMPSLTKNFVYFTAQHWKKIDFDATA